MLNFFSLLLILRLFLQILQEKEEMPQNLQHLFLFYMQREGILESEAVAGSVVPLFSIKVELELCRLILLINSQDDFPYP